MSARLSPDITCAPNHGDRSPGPRSGARIIRLQNRGARPLPPKSTTRRRGPARAAAKEDLAA